jgi:NADH dehydrogenase
MKKEKKKIVILGGGFGGLYTYKGLYKYFHKDELDITIVNRTNYFLFTPLLHEVATGGIAHHQLVESLRQIIYKTNDHLHVAELVSIDCENKKVKTTIGELSYDVLVVALGATTNFFNAPGAEENSLVLKDLHDAIKLRTTLIESFERATEIKDEAQKRRELSFAVVGGGPTGVELVTEIAELINDTFLKYYHGLIKCEDISLYLINRDNQVLMPFHPSLRKGALSVIEKSGVKVLLNTGVKEVKKGSIILNDDTSLDVNHVIWTAGVKPNAPKFSHQATLDTWGRIIVDDALSIPECPGVFVVGDIASSPTKDGKPLPMLAQVAVKQGLHTGGNIYRFIKGNKLLPFSYESNGSLVSLGQWQALADLKFIRFSGPVAWFIWRTVYLFKFLSHSKKIKIVLDWTVNIFYPRDITKA